MCQYRRNFSQKRKLLLFQQHSLKKLPPPTSNTYKQIRILYVMPVADFVFVVKGGTSRTSSPTRNQTFHAFLGFAKMQIDFRD